MRTLFHRITCQSLVLLVCFSPTYGFSAETNSSRSPNVMPNFGYVSPKDTGRTAEADALREGKLLMRILFLGAVSQGIHYFPEDTDLLTCMMYIGGYTEDADLNGISVRRKGVKDLIEVKLEDLMEEGEDIPALKDGDIVNVAYSWRRDVTVYYTLTSFITSLAALGTAIVALSM